MVKRILILSFLLLRFAWGMAQPSELCRYNLVWNSQSKNSGESMLCGGGDIGLNVWVEKGELLFYIARSGTFDENNTLLKLGRVRVKLSPNPFEGGEFRQELVLKDGNVRISGKKGGLSADVRVWVDVFHPVIHVDVSGNKPLVAEASFESWRYTDRFPKGKENNANSWKWAPKGIVTTREDEIAFEKDKVLFYHHNTDSTVFDAAVIQQGMDKVKDQLYNPVKNLLFGGILYGHNMKEAGTSAGKYLDTDFRRWTIKSKKPAVSHDLFIALNTEQTKDTSQWRKKLATLLQSAIENTKSDYVKSTAWWNQYWDRSYICIQPSASGASSDEWKIGRNYQLFRYMLGCNAFGQWPTKFNGGLFTYDPSLTDSALKFTPDFRNWGGGTHTAQNQRLVYWPMLKSGDFDLMKPQFEFYMRALKNAELRSQVYWGHKGACFTEQLENFGLPNPAEYNWKRPEWYDKGMEYNAWLEYEWDTVLEFCLMMLEEERYTGRDITVYIPFIESCLTFFNEHYQYLAKMRGSKMLDGNGHLVFYPGSGAETYKMAYNASSTISGLRIILSRLLELPEKYLDEQKRQQWALMLNRVPPLSFRESDGHPTIAPAKLWARVNNTETAQLYPVFPWGIYGIGKPGLDTAINTYRYDADALKFRSHIGWKQDNIFAARLGLTEEASRLTLLKLGDSGRRFPAFWGPGYDWTPDHNWGGSGMIGLQEMLMQTSGRKIHLLPAWPKTWDVHFKLRAPYETTVEAVVIKGKIVSLNVIPSSRAKDVEVIIR
ncbi:hypothetical protein BDE36_3863 [Arcticibacter tournemirensis]|uniref:DUF5703 domain-containing protein n=1 Tax=Arcticibacter tournemirensis TaxID=699437 RepID=A0A5M9HLI0_9SPHI|nr:DUF5703 domain-containing protein [Arcticibacter tournemirensis]KAA8486264.1 hypothetical protein F1649_01345 [Arcticibacter tournemirensis]TQM52065.1 hypothetical protein BDE36_3863 [Arcticibacter tournemirensis]